MPSSLKLGGEEKGGKKMQQFHAAVLFAHDSPFIIQVDDPWPLLLIREMCAEGGNEAVSYYRSLLCAKQVNRRSAISFSICLKMHYRSGGGGKRQAGHRQITQAELSDDLQPVQSYCQPSVNTRVAVGVTPGCLICSLMLRTLAQDYS